MRAGGDIWLCWRREDRIQQVVVVQHRREALWRGVIRAKHAKHGELLAGLRQLAERGKLQADILQNERHADGDMFPPSYDQFEKFLIQSCAESFFIELWKDDRLVCVSTCDMLDDGLSAVYTFFDPDESHRSLGVFAVLKQIEYIQSLEQPYVYLGYWVPHSRKMNYKSQYAPIELLLDGQWRRINRHLNAEEITQLGDMLMTTLPSEWNEPILK